DDPQAGAFFDTQLRAQSGGSAVTTLRLDARADSAAYARVLGLVPGFDAVVVAAFTAVRAGSGGLPAPQRAFVDGLAARGRPVALVSFGSPYVPAGLARQPDAYVAAYGASEASQRAAA